MTTPDSIYSVRPSWGGPLGEADYASLERSWIPRGLADQAMLRRVTSIDGAQMLGRCDRNSYEGIVFPFKWPGEDHIREYWLRRDRPEIEYDTKGRPREKNKYLGPPGRGSLLYVFPGTDPELLGDIRVPIAITEGAKKTIALHRLSWHGLADAIGLPRFLAVGLGGVWSFIGTIGKTPGPDGSQRPEKGLIADLRRLTWDGRRVYIVFDSNVHTNSKVAAARRRLSAELTQLGAQVYWVNLPKPDEGSNINGVDDLLAASGPETVLDLFQRSEPAASNAVEPSQAQKLIRLCEEVEVFRTPEGESYAHIPVGEHRETWLLRSKGFSRWLGRQFHQSSGKPARTQALQEAIGVLEAKAQFESPEMRV